MVTSAALPVVSDDCTSEVGGAHGEGAHDYIPIAGLQLLLYFAASAGIPPSPRAATPSSPSESSDDGSTAALPAAPSVGGD